MGNYNPILSHCRERENLLRENLESSEKEIAILFLNIRKTLLHCLHLRMSEPGEKKISKNKILYQNKEKQM